MLADKPSDATKFKIALEQALYPELKIAHGKGSAVKIERSYELEDPQKHAAWYVNYATKNARLPGPKIKGSAIYLSRDLVQSAKIMWDIIREVD